jgi:hypothetical protein
MAVNMHRSPIGAWWRWRSELAALLVLSGSFLFGWWRLASWLWPLLILAVLALALALVPTTRRFFGAWFWSLFTRHRLQRSFWELRLHTRAGRLPLIPLIFSTPVGCRALVVLRAGMTFEDFEDSAAAFATACGARDCRVTASNRSAWFVWIDLIRRDVLGPARVIRSPLADHPALDPFDAPAWPDSALIEE